MTATIIINGQTTVTINGGEMIVGKKTSVSVISADNTSISVDDMNISADNG